jgi:hypothetical protein
LQVLTAACVNEPVLERAAHPAFAVLSVLSKSSIVAVGEMKLET